MRRKCGYPTSKYMFNWFLARAHTDGGAPGFPAPPLNHGVHNLDMDSRLPVGRNNAEAAHRELAENMDATIHDPQLPANGIRPPRFIYAHRFLG
jgi:hypothetical protein